MDLLYSSQREKVQRISVEHTMKVLGGRIGLVFYDVTTLYFETTPGVDDDLRQNGFSKDGKTAEAQIVLGLLVSEDGYPLSYSIFNGKQYEGYTMIPIIDDFVQRFSLTDFVVVADSGLMNAKNIRLLHDAGYKYILGARIRSESPVVKEWILSIEKENGNIAEHRKENGQRLVVSYSDGRAKKNAHNRAFTYTSLIVFQFPAQPTFQFFNGWQSGFYILWQRFPKFIIGNAYRLMYITQSVFCHNTVLVLAKKQPDSLVVPFPTKNIVHRRTIEIQFTDIFRLECTAFEFHY